MAMLSPALASPIEQLEAQARWRTADEPAAVAETAAA